PERHEQGGRGSHPGEPPRSPEPGAEAAASLGRLLPRRAFGAQAAPETCREILEVGLAGVVRKRHGQVALPRLELVEGGATVGALRQVAVRLGPRSPRQLAIQQGPEILLAQVLHEVSPVRVLRHRLSSARARDSRDITVPIGTARVRAISSYERPSTTRRTSTT